MRLLQEEILSNEKYGENIYKMEIFSPYICRNVKAGQFINIRCSSGSSLDPLLRRPFSVFDLEEKFNVFSILYIVRGKGTKYMTSLKKGDILDFAGPLGRGIDLEQSQKDILLVGGGIGIAPLYLISKIARQKGKKVLVIAGFRDSSLIRWERDLARWGIKYRIFTEDGSWGEKGLVADYLCNELNQFKNFEIFCCGPVDMIVRLQEIFSGLDNKVTAILEEKMGCGIGACMGCMVKIRSKKDPGFTYKKACIEGPAFDLGEVIFD